MLQWELKSQKLNHGLSRARYAGNTRPTKLGIGTEVNTNAESVFV